MANEDDIAKRCFLTGSEAVRRENWDYAIEMFGKAAEMVPANRLYRETLRNSEFKKYANNKTGAGMMAKTKLMGIRGKISKARGKKEWNEVDKACEEGLKLNPWDPTLNMELGRACRERGYGEVAVYSFGLAVASTGDPKNKSFLKEYAELLKDRDQFDEASAVWQKIQMLDPEDSEARTMVMWLQAQKTIHRGNFEEATSTRDVMSDENVAKKISKRTVSAEDATAPGQSVEADLKRAIRKDPENKDLHLKLAEFLRREGRLEEAIEEFTTADQMSGGNSDIREQREEVELVLLKQTSDRAVQAYRENEADKNLGRIAKEARDKYRLRQREVLEIRIKRHPQDMRTKLDLANIYRREKRWADAIPLLQQAAADKRLEIDAIIGLGKCFIQDGRPQLAVRQFERIIDRLRFDERPDDFKEIHYYLGRISEKRKDAARAMDHYSQILAADYDYEDVRDRIDRIENGDLESPSK